MGLLVIAHLLRQMGGPALTEELREDGADVPIMLPTRERDPEVRAEALRRGADNCLSRPVEGRELTARLRALLRRPGAWEPVQEIQVGPLLVDAPEREAYAHGNRVGLPRKEFDLLYLLADRSPQVVTREEMATRVWGTGEVSDNSIQVRISGLRDGLRGALPEEAGLSVRTVREIGYQLRPR